MIRIVTIASLLIGMTLLLHGCASTQKTGQTEAATTTETAASEACPVCAAAKADGTGWCDKCNSGYVNGEKVKCKACYEGKIGKTTWCDHCNVGFIDGKKVKCKACFEKKAGCGTATCSAPAEGAEKSACTCGQK